MKRFWAWIGTRPEAIKMCPLVRCLRERGAAVRVGLSGQHRDMVAPVLDFFGVRADVSLDVMRADEGLQALSERLLCRMARAMRESDFSPDACLVHGDTTTAFVGALCAFYAGIPVCHVEAGLRTGDVHAPFPEEFNRRAVDAMSDLYFAPTAAAAARLAAEGVPRERVHCVGNTATDAVRLCLAAACRHPLLDAAKGRRLLVLTSHRRELTAERRHSLFAGIRAEIEGRDDVLLVLPVHPSPRVRAVALSAFAGCENARLTAPLTLPLMQQLVARASLLLTDSGGLQEEATYLGIPTLVLREQTERPEGVAAGVLRVVGCEARMVREQLGALLEDERARRAMAIPSDVYGDGHVSERIAEILLHTEGRGLS